MSKTTRAVAAVVAGVVLAGAAWAATADWPQWRGANRDGKAAGFTPPETWPKELAAKWKVTVGSGDSTPALVGDKLYVFARQGDDEVTLCLNVADGKEVWKDTHPGAKVTGAAASHPGPRSSPAVADGKVVTLGVGGVVSCLNAADGKPVWRNEDYKAVPQFFTSCSPLITDGLAIVQLGGKGKGATVAFALADGKEKWKWDAEAAAYSSPVLMTVDGVKQVVAMTDKSVAGLAAADGKLLWSVPFAPAGRMGYNAATPIVDGQTVIISGGGRGTKALKVEKKGEEFAATELWANAEQSVQFNTPVLKGELLFGLSEKNNLFCINAKTGKTAWAGTDKQGARGFGSVVDAGAVLLALANNSELVVFKPSDQKYEEVAKIKVAATETYAYPVVAADGIYVKDKDALALLTVK